MIYILAVVFGALGLLSINDTSRGYLAVMAVILYYTSQVLERLEERR